MSKRISILLLILLSATLLSLPFLVQGTGFLSLVAFVPLLFAEELAYESKMKGFCWWHYLCFLLWNAATTFWVCNATVGGGIFACLANAFQMSLVFGLFRWSRKHTGGPLPYIFLVFAWIAWERYYLTWAQISWPWLVLGNSFARTTNWIQWYEYTGTLGGSLWIWASNLSFFGILMSLRSGRWKKFNGKARTACVAGAVLLYLAPPTLSLMLRPEPSDETLEVFIAQPNIDPYNKFGGMSQEEQNNLLISQLSQAPKDSTILLIAPETFIHQGGDIITNDLSMSPSLAQFKAFLSDRPQSSLLIGAESFEYVKSHLRPSHTARKRSEDLWLETHNSALMLSSSDAPRIFHKSKLVVGVEMMPYPAFFRPVDEKLGGVMGRCIGQKEVTNLNASSVPVGTAICYESVYGEYCTQYVRKGARLLTVITNDAWWGDTPGYKQHLSYASLRAIETRRWIARCGNTGISAFIDPSGRIVSRTEWWKQDVLRGRVVLSDEETFFVRHGDFVGRICVLMFLLLLCGAVVRRFTE